MSRIGASVLAFSLLLILPACAPSGDWQLSRPATAGEIEGYASRPSAAPGESLGLHVSTRSRRFDTRIYRLGWYEGSGARLFLEVRGTPGGPQPTPQPRAGDGLVTCDWPVSLKFRVGDDWPSGAYLARLSGDGKQAFVPFVVREPRSGSRRAPYVLMLNTLTWQAYNSWGGKSLYDFNSQSHARAIRISFDRPYGSGPGAWAGLGAGELLTTPHTKIRAGWEYPMIRWLEKSGIDVATVADLDVDADSTLLQGRRGVLIVGHPEYWTRHIRNAMDRARDSGVGIALFGANAGYWQVRLEADSSSGGPPATPAPPATETGPVVFCAKDYTRDPLYDTAADKDLTVRFRNLHPRRPEVALFGIQTVRGEESVAADFVPDPEARGSWIYRGTGVASGATRSIPGLIGYEVDRSLIADSLYDAWSPPGLQILARSAIRFHDGTAERSDAVTYRAPSGAVVFAAGTMQWSWGLDDWGAPKLRPARRHADAERITLNVIDALGGDGAPGPSSRSPR